MRDRKRRLWPKSCRLLPVLIVLVLLPPLFAGEEPKHERNAAAVAAPKNVAELKTIETQVKKLVDKILPCTVGVQVGAARGSGVIISEDGYVMTAGHVVDMSGRDVTFFLSDGKTVKGKTLGLFKNVDAGLMKISDAGKWPFAEKGRSADLKPGTWCVATGHPLGYQEERPAVIRVGRILRVRETTIQTDCPLVGGDSGGPLFDLAGKVIGINSRIGGSTLMNYHVPIDVFHDNWDRLVKGDAWQIDMPGRDSDEVKAAFRDVVTAAGKCAVRVTCDGKEAVLGTIVGPDGWIVTKASELRGKIVCRMRDGRELDALYVGLHEPFDLAMLKIDAFDLPVVEWSRAEPAMGQWVAVPAPADEPLAVGVVSVPRRKIPPISGILGVVLKEGKDGAPIEKVLPKTPAEKAGLKPDDVITHVNGKATPNRRELIGAVKKHRPGETVKLKVKRGDKDLDFSVRLAKLDTPESRKRQMQNSMGVGLSKRRDAFPAVLQHDTVLKPIDCGGPLVDLSGKVIGVNIARGGRTETYCVPSEVLIPLMYDLMSGNLTPPDVKKERLRKAEEERKKAEAAKKAEEERKKAEAAKKAEEERKKAEAAKKAEEDRKKAEAAKKAEEARKKAEAEEEERKKAEAAKKAEEERKKAEAAKKAEEERKKAEAEKQPQPEKEPADEQKPPEEQKPDGEKQPEQQKPEPDKAPQDESGS